jgi:hypothetical protein
MCGPRPPCPCSWRTCKCGAKVAIAQLDARQARAFCAEQGIEQQDIEVPVVRGSAGDPAGRLAVWERPDGVLVCVELAPGEQLVKGQWRGVEHVGECQPL